MNSRAGIRMMILAASLIFFCRGEVKMDIIITSTAFASGGAIPSRYACDGANVSPPLAWQGIPANAKSLALVCNDPDAPVGDWVHWVIFNIPPASVGIPEALPAQKELTDGSRQGMNDFRRIGWGGPCPPGAGAHRYFFTLYALDQPMELEAGATRARLLQVMAGHIVGQGQLMARYTRR